MTAANCYSCVNRRDVPGDCHISCAKPDPTVRGNPVGIRGGWFHYPYNFDPIWIVGECKNYEKKE